MTDAPLTYDDETQFEKNFLPPFSTGEIIVSGAHVLQEYYNNPEALLRNKIFVGKTCWHRTGDSGFTDGSGGLFLTGRCSGLIRRRDGYISQFIYENFLQEKCFVFGTVVEVNGAVTIAAEGAEREKQRIRTTLQEGGLQFDRVVMLNKMPRDQRHHSKIEYSALIRSLPP